MIELVLIRDAIFGGVMQRKENTPGRESRRRYEERNKEKRKQASGNFGTMIPRELLEEINAFLKAHGFTKVKLIEEGYQVLQEKVKEENGQLNTLNRPLGQSG